MLESQLSTFAEKQTITDEAWRQQGRLGIKFLYKDANGKDIMPDKFLPMAEAIMYNTFYTSQEVQGWLGQRMTTPSDKTGYPIKTGPGVRQLLKDSWTEPYSGALTVNKLKDFLMQIFFTRVDQGDRNVVAVTGEYGMFMFHDMLAAEASSFLTATNDYTKILQENPRHLAFGAQFTAYQGPNGMYVTLLHNPLYDSLEFCKETHPQYPNVPVDSFRYTFLDFGKAKYNKGMADNNIMMLKKANSYAWGVKPGMLSPTGLIQGGTFGALEMSYDVAIQGTSGVHIFDVSRCGELYFDTNN